MLSDSDLPTGWKTVRVKDVCILGRGRVISQIELDQHQGTYPVYSSQSKDSGVFGHIETFDFDGEYVTWTTDGAYAGTVFHRSGKFNCTNVCGTLKAKAPELDMRFLAFALTPRTSKHVSYVGNPKLMNNVMAEIVVPLPPPAEQRRIADILDTADAAIQKTEALIAKLKQMKQGLLHDLLTRGLDDNGQLRDPIAHPEQFKDSPLGRVPKEWFCVRLAEVVPRAEYGISVSLDDDDGIPVLRMNNIMNGEVDLADLKTSVSEEAKSLRLEPLNVLFNRTNSIEHVGRTGIWRGQLPYASFASYLVRLVPKHDKLHPEYLNLWLNLPETQLLIRRYATPGVHQVNINPTNLRKTLIALPGKMPEQERIVRNVGAQNVRIRAEEKYLDKLKQIKKGLMHDLLTGKVRVEEGSIE